MIRQHFIASFILLVIAIFTASILFITKIHVAIITAVVSTMAVGGTIGVISSIVMIWNELGKIDTK